MAETKKLNTVKTAAEKQIPTAVVKPAAAPAPAVEKAEKVLEKQEEVKAETKAAAKEAKPKKTAVKAQKAAAKKAPVKAAPAKTEKSEAKKTVTKTGKQVINLQFSGKSYTMEDLMKIANDVWKFDLHKSDEAYKSIELYVKPEENVAYYVFNGELEGSFFI